MLSVVFFMALCSRLPDPYRYASFLCHSAGSQRCSSSRHRARMRRGAFARLWRRSVRDFRSCLWAVVCGRSSRIRRVLPTSGVRQHTQLLVPTFGRRVRFECYPCWFSPPSVGSVNRSTNTRFRSLDRLRCLHRGWRGHIPRGSRGQRTAREAEYPR